MYTHFTSHHPRVKSGTIRCPARRAEKVCDDTEKEKEMLHLHETFKRNGYPEQVISRNLKPNPRTQTTPDENAQTKKPPTLFLPYVATRPVREDTNSKQEDWSENHLQVAWNPETVTDESENKNI